MARRSRGTGGLFIHTEKNGRESWYGQWRIGNRRVRRRIGPKREPGARTGLTRSQAERELQRRIDEDSAAPELLDATIGSIGSALLDHLQALGRKPSTLGDYESCVRVHLKPFFGETALERIERPDVESFIAAKRREGKATKSILNYLGILNSIFAYAEKRDIVQRNPVTAVDKPRAGGVDPDVRFLTDEELEDLLVSVPDDARGPMERTMYLTAAFTGLRQGELIGLRWRDVDWSAGRIRVRQNYVRGQFGTPKSRRSTRSVPMADRVAGALDRHHQASAYGSDDDLVFAHPETGKPLDRSRLLKRFKAAAKRGGVRDIRFHDLRHTFGTRMAAAGVPLRTLQEWLGHRDFKTTLIYADYQPGDQEAELVERAFGHCSNGCSKLSKTEGTSEDRKRLNKR